MKNYNNFILTESVTKDFYCVQGSIANWYWKFTAGKYYKMYISPKRGERFKDDNDRFVSLGFFDKNVGDNYTEYHNTFGVILTDSSYEDYLIRKDSKKFGI